MGGVDGRNTVWGGAIVRFPAGFAERSIRHELHNQVADADRGLVEAPPDARNNEKKRRHLRNGSLKNESVLKNGCSSFEDHRVQASTRSFEFPDAVRGDEFLLATCSGRFGCDDSQKRRLNDKSNTRTPTTIFARMRRAISTVVRETFSAASERRQSSSSTMVEPTLVSSNRMDFDDKEKFDLKATVAGYIGAYLDSTADSPAQEDALRSISAGLSRILTELLDENEDWYRGCWFDDIVPVEIRALTRDELYIEGIAIWGDHSRSQWVEPVEVTVGVTDGRDAISKYIVKVGDARRGLVRVALRSEASTEPVWPNGCSCLPHPSGID